MALVKCRECGEQVSTSAQSCPKCGAKLPKKTSLLTWAVLIFIIYVVYTANQTPRTPTSSSAKPDSSPAAAEKPQWKTSTSADEMTGKRQAFAISPTVYPTKKMGFPYNDVNAWLGIGCDGKSEWAYIGFNMSPNLADTETENGYNRIRTRIKWNESIENVTLVQDWGASFIHFQNDRDAILKMTSSTSALLELKWHGEQSTYFIFSLDGASTAVKAMRDKCAKREK